MVCAANCGAGPSAQFVAAMRDDRWSLALVAGDLRRDRFRRFLSLQEVDERAGEIEGLCRLVDDTDPVPVEVLTPREALTRLAG